MTAVDRKHNSENLVKLCNAFGWKPNQCLREIRLLDASPSLNSILNKYHASTVAKQHTGWNTEYKMSLQLQKTLEHRSQIKDTNSKVSVPVKAGMCVCNIHKNV